MDVLEKCVLSECVAESGGVGSGERVVGCVGAVAESGLDVDFTGARLKENFLFMLGKGGERRARRVGGGEGEGGGRGRLIGMDGFCIEYVYAERVGWLVWFP